MEKQGIWIRGFVILLTAIIAFLLLQILIYGYGRDQGIYAMVAKTILDGGMPYRDAFDFKPPGIFLIYTLARVPFGDAQWGIRLLEVLGLVGMAVAMVKLAKVWWGDARIGWIAATLAIIVHAQLDFWHTAQPESFGGMLTMFALLIACPHEGKSSDPKALIASGMLFGFAGLLKPPLAFGGVVLAAWLALSAAKTLPKTSRLALIRHLLRPVLWVAIGGILPIALCICWFAAKGALRDLVQVLFVFTPPYTALSWQDKNVLEMAYQGIIEWLMKYSGPMFLGLACLCILGIGKKERLPAALLFGIIAMYLAGIIAQGKFFPYHYGAIWPPTAMLAALGLFKAFDVAFRRGRKVAVLLAIVLIAFAFGRSATKDVEGSYLARCLARTRFLLGGARDQAELDRLASAADVNTAANRAVALLLRDKVPENNPIFVWGFEPVIYDMSSRPPATKYIYNVPQRVAWAKQQTREQLMRDLAAKPPEAIVVERYDVFPFVTGSPIDSKDTLKEFPALLDLMTEHYTLDTTIEDFDVYLKERS